MLEIHGITYRRVGVGGSEEDDNCVLVFMLSHTGAWPLRVTHTVIGTVKMAEYVAWDRSIVLQNTIGIHSQEPAQFENPEDAQRALERMD